VRLAFGDFLSRMSTDSADRAGTSISPGLIHRTKTAGLIKWRKAPINNVLAPPIRNQILSQWCSAYAYTYCECWLSVDDVITCKYAACSRIQILQRCMDTI
jgi:hypothetical protein